MFKIFWDDTSTTILYYKHLFTKTLQCVCKKGSPQPRMDIKNEKDKGMSEDFLLFSTKIRSIIQENKHKNNIKSYKIMITPDECSNKPIKHSQNLKTI